MASTCSGSRIYRDTSCIRNSPPLGPLQKDYAMSPMVVLGGGAVFYECGTLAGSRVYYCKTAPTSNLGEPLSHLGSRIHRGTSLIRNCHFRGPYTALCLVPYTALRLVPCGGPWGGAVSYERGTPVLLQNGPATFKPEKPLSHSAASIPTTSGATL